MSWQGTCSYLLLSNTCALLFTRIHDRLQLVDNRGCLTYISHSCPPQQLRMRPMPALPRFVSMNSRDVAAL